MPKKPTPAQLAILETMAKYGVKVLQHKGKAYVMGSRFREQTLLVLRGNGWVERDPIPTFGDSGRYFVLTDLGRSQLPNSTGAEGGEK